MIPSALHAPALVLAAALLAACGARSSLRVPEPAPGVGGAGGSGGASVTSSTASAGGSECVPVPGIAAMSGRVRDFPSSHPDFEKLTGDDPGILEGALDADGKPVYAHPDGTTLTTTGKANFDAWYRDTPGVNQSEALAIPLFPVGGGVAFDSEAFFPIDGELLGNEGETHNFHFTLEAHTHFQHVGGELFRFAGDDDLWAFIDGHLAIDLGGVHGTEGKEIAIDDLGLTPGQTYALDIFFAERHTIQSTLHVELLGFDLCL